MKLNSYSIRDQVCRFIPFSSYWKTGADPGGTMLHILLLSKNPAETGHSEGSGIYTEYIWA